MTTLSAKLLALVAMGKEATPGPVKVHQMEPRIYAHRHVDTAEIAPLFKEEGYFGDKRAANLALLVHLWNALPDIERAAKALESTEELKSVLQDARERMVGRPAAMMDLRYRADMALAKARTTLAAEAGK